MKQDIYQRVTDKIVADLEKGDLTWLKPWSAGNMEGRIVRPLRHNGMPYNGINVLMLWGAAVEAGYLSPHWMTFKQAKELGAHVRKGERGNLVVYPKAQVEAARDYALGTITNSMNKAMRADAAASKRRQNHNSFLSITLDVKGGRDAVLVPVAAAEPMRLRTTCESCGCRYSYVGAAYFCPSCGANSASHR